MKKKENEKGQLEIEYVDIDTLRPWAKNPRVHDVGMIEKSIKTVDVTQPVLVQRATNRIIAGHGRIKAMRNHGIRQVPIVYLDMDDQTADAYALVDNQTALSGDWDDALLGEILSDFDDGFLADWDFEKDVNTNLLDDYVIKEYDEAHIFPLKSTFFLVAVPPGMLEQAIEGLRPLRDMEGVQIVQSR